MQKKGFVVIAAALGVLLAFFIVLLVMNAVSLGQIHASRPDTLTVYGQGRVSVPPDVAVVTLGYENSASTPESAEADNACVAAQIAAAVREAGVAECDIAVMQYSIYQEYCGCDAPQTRSYRVSRVLALTVRNAERAGDVIAAACRAGANVSYGITYDLADRRKAYAQALELARGRAEEKAAELASSMGRRLAGIADIKETAAVSNSDCWGCGYPGAALADFVGAGACGGLQVSAAVTLTYRLE
jgi:uncharacterized protein YggE